MRKEKFKAGEATAFLKNRTRMQPRIGLLAGTGLSEFASDLQVAETIAYEQIPHFPASTVQSHPGRLVFGRLADQPVVAMQGRFHLYEGYDPLQVSFPIRVMQEMGIRVLIVTNAAGGLNPAYSPGDLMLIADHLNLTGFNPLVGPNEESWGVRFPHMAFAYDSDLLKLAEQAGQNCQIPLQKGVYAALLGPSLETPAEIRFLRTIGADAVGLSTVHEVIVGVHAGMRILGISIITNVHDPDNPAPAVLEEIIATAEKSSKTLGLLLRNVVEALHD